MPNRTNLHILTFILAVLLTGCSIMEHGDNPCPDTDDSEFINISFRLVTSPTASTRTNEESQYGEMDSEWPELEDCIYYDDFIFFIYALYDNKENFIMKVDNITSLTDPHTNISGGPSNYTLKVSIPKTVFENVVPTEVENIKLRIDAFANTNKNKTLSGTNPPIDNTFRELGDTASKWIHYNIFDLIYPGTGTTDGKLKSGARIPMFGTVTIEVTREELYKSRPYAPIWGDDMHMLRSLAKIKVIDNYSNPDGETSAPHIATVAFTSSTPNAYILPKNALLYRNGDQVTSPNPFPGKPTEITLLKQDDSWIGYIPEQYITDSVKFIIKIINSDSKTEDFVVPMTKYNDQELNFGEAILRNHIYTLSVNKIETQLDITATVKNWVEKELTLDYTATPSVTQKLKWTKSTYESYDSIHGVVVVKPASTVESIVPVKGSFVLETPEGATWHAFLIPSTGNGNPYAFQFKDKNNNYVSSLSGIVVPGDTIFIEIYPRIVEPEENNEVFLQTVVTLGSGNVIEVPVTPAGMTYKNFTILQNKQ